MKISKKILVLSILAFLIFSSFLLRPSFAFEESEFYRIEDDGGFLSNDEISSLNLKLDRVSEEQELEVVIKTVNSTDEIDIKEYVSKINTIDKITMAYAVDKENIKSKNNLIF